MTITETKFCSACNSQQLHEKIKTTNGKWQWKCKPCRIRYENATQGDERRRQNEQIKGQIQSPPPPKKGR